ncbi:endonuclease domain-containing protein [Streptomyces sp. NPDC054841]
MISQKLAARYLADELHGCVVPMDPELFRYKRFTQHDFVFFGHVPVRAYKHANRWRFSEADVRSAGRAIASLPWDPGDLVAPRLGDGRGPEAGAHTSWRVQIHRAIQGAGAAVRRESGCPCGPLFCRQDNGWDMPCGLTPDGLLQRYGGYSIACTLPVPTLVWAEDTWLIPRTLAFILDQWEEAEGRLDAAAQPCSGCGMPSPNSSWPTSATTGWKVLCPACAAASLRLYSQELKGVTYARVRERGPRAEDYLCTVCDPPRPAAVWDHCHEHGLVRGPLCGSCNTMEGHGMEFLARQGSVRHLLRCEACRTLRSLPQHHRLAMLRRHLHAERGASGCDWPMHMCVSLTECGDGAYDYRVRCPGQRASSRGLLTAREVEHVLSLTVETGAVEPLRD